MTEVNNKPDIIVLGTGVSGVTTALTLQLLGYQTRLIGAKLLTQEPADNQAGSLFASRYPAASIIPHSVQSERLEVLFKDSQKVYRALHETSPKFVRKNTHYEWFRYPVSAPVYSDWMEDFEMIDEKDSSSFSQQLFRKISDNTVHGWSFSCYFVDWNSYAPHLYEWYEEMGGAIEKKRVTPQDIKAMEVPYIVNCTGAYSRELFQDDKDFCFLLGKSLIVEDASTTDQGNTITSYNYTPGAEVYSHSSGCPVDLYCYPRDTGWVLGGSRLHGHLDKKGRWSGEEWTGRMLSIDKQQVPAPIYEINRDLIQKIYNFDIAGCNLRALSGYRFMRDSKNRGLRLEEDRQLDKIIFHNYGHGGAGVTLSWGCALQVARLVRNHLSPSKSDQSGYSMAVLESLHQNLKTLF